MSTKKAKKTKLNNLIIVLLLSALLLLMSTYAWFTANRTVRVDTIDVNVTTSGGLQISADAKTWKSVITKRDISNAQVVSGGSYNGAVTQLPTDMEPVSSDMTLDGSGHLKMFFGKAEANLDATSANYGGFDLTSVLQEDIKGTQAVDGVASQGCKYIVFDLFLKYDSGTDSPLYMTGTVQDTVQETINGETGTASPSGASKGLQNAARVALVKASGTVESSDLTGSAQSLATTGGSVISWEPYTDVHTSTGVANAEALKTTETTPRTWTQILGAVTESSPTILPYDGLNSAFTKLPLGDLITGGPQASAVTRISPTVTTQAGATLNYQLPDGIGANTIQKYRVYMWVEGQDVDCENSASGSYMFYSLSFSLDSFV